MKDMEEQENQVVRLGDASIASPFTSKLSTPLCSKWILWSITFLTLSPLQMTLVSLMQWNSPLSVERVKYTFNKLKKKTFVTTL